MSHTDHMTEAIRLAEAGMLRNEGGPFGCIIVREGLVVGRGHNMVTSNCDPTAHAEIVAIRDACMRLNTFQLTGCELYTSCEPCPMCLGAIYWARPDVVYYACTKEDAAAIAFDDQFIYAQLDLLPDQRAIPMHQMMRDEGWAVFEKWKQKEDKIQY